MLPDLAHGQDIFGSPELRTKMKILHAVDKSLDRITIAEICENAGISRQTFYRHFQSKYDIPWWHSIFCRQFYLNEIGRTIDWKTGYYHHLRLIAQERDFYRKSIQYSINTPFGQTVMPENRKTVLLETLEKYHHVTVNDNMRFIVEIFSKLECEVLNDWFRSDAPTDLVRWTDDLVSLVPDRLYRALRIDEPGGTSGWLGAPTSCGRSGGGFGAAGAHHRSKNTFSEAIPCFSSDDAHHACGRCGKRFSGSA